MPRDISHIPIARTNHPPGKGLSVMELVAYAADEPVTNEPRSASPALAAWMRVWADHLDDDRREELRSHVIPLSRSRGAHGVEVRRQWMIADWLLRTAAPLWLRYAGLAHEAADLAAMPEVRSAARLWQARLEAQRAEDAAHRTEVDAWKAAEARYQVVGPRAVRQLVDRVDAAVGHTMTGVAPAARAVGFTGVPPGQLPPAWRAAVGEIEHSARSLAWNEATKAGDSLAAGLSDRDRATWRIVQDRVRAALQPAGELVHSAAHELVAQVLTIG